MPKSFQPIGVEPIFGVGGAKFGTLALLELDGRRNCNCRIFYLTNFRSWKVRHKGKQKSFSRADRFTALNSDQ